MRKKEAQRAQVTYKFEHGPSLQHFLESHPFLGNGIETKASKYNNISSLLVYNGRSS